MPMERRGATVKRVNQFKLSPEACKAGPYKGYERLDWINSAASRNREARVMNLLHHFNVNNLRQAFRQLDGSKAIGIDQTTKKEYAKNLEENLTQLADKIYRGGWRPKPSRQVLIPKPNGGTRPLAIGCLEDKIAQLLMAKILDALYEPIFHRHSFGFRPGKNAHQALARLYSVIKIRLNEDKSGILKFDSKSPQGPLPFVGFVLYWGCYTRTRKILKVKTAPKKLAKCLNEFVLWIKTIRHKKKLDVIWDLAAAKLRGHYQYYGVSFNHSKLHHYYFATVGALYKWLNRRSQKRSFTWERFLRRLVFKPLPRPTSGALLLDITNGLGTKLKHKPRSRMRKLRKSGSNRSAGWQQLAFT
jgi:hypothetical protein